MRGNRDPLLRNRAYVTRLSDKRMQTVSESNCEPVHFSKSQSTVDCSNGCRSMDLGRAYPGHYRVAPPSWILTRAELAGSRCALLFRFGSAPSPIFEGLRSVVS